MYRVRLVKVEELETTLNRMDADGYKLDYMLPHLTDPTGGEGFAPKNETVSCIVVFVKKDKPQASMVRPLQPPRPPRLTPDPRPMPTT